MAPKVSSGLGVSPEANFQDSSPTKQARIRLLVHGGLLLCERGALNILNSICSVAHETSRLDTAETEGTYEMRRLEHFFELAWDVSRPCE